MKAGCRRCAGQGFIGALWTLAALGCTPLFYPINYPSIRGAVGHPLNAPSRVQCADPRVLSPAIVEGGYLPPGITLQPDGLLSGTPRTAGHWHAMIRQARVQCGEQVFPDERMGLNFDITESPKP
ncbi:MAG TPA: hypothetical protein VLF14_11470 [Candidatus Binatia bacterium]|nr:hypothetical protein [Candidatus Binatia bacterium]